MKFRPPKPAGFAGILTLSLIEIHRGGGGEDKKKKSEKLDPAGERE
jgi:hypothetical protein